MSKYLSLNRETLSEMTRLFAETVIPNLEAFEDKAAELQDEKLYILTTKMRATLEEVPPELLPPETTSSLTKDVALYYKYLSVRQLRVVNLWVQIADRLIELNLGRRNN